MKNLMECDLLLSGIALRYGLEDWMFESDRSWEFFS
jgi:hypothetical protein